MKLIDIYNPKPRLSADWARAMRALLADFSKVHPKLAPKVGEAEGDPVIADEDIDALPALPVVQPYAFRLELGERSFSFPSAEVHRAKEFPSYISPEFRRMMEAKQMVPVAGSLPVAAIISGFPFPCGVYLVCGAGNSGKTPMAHTIAQAIVGDAEEGFGLLRYGEPFCGYNKSEAEAGAELVDLVVKHRVVVIDSLKDTMTQMTGGLMEAGLSRGILPLFSRLSMMASELGCVIIIPINPSSQKDSVVELIGEIARSNVAMAVINDGREWTLLARQGEGQLRAAGTARLSFTKNVPSLQVTSVSEVTEATVDKMMTSLQAVPTAADNSTTNLGRIVRKMAKLED